MRTTGRHLSLTYIYTGYPMVKEARALGAVRKVYVEYPQGWLSTLAEGDAGNRQAGWRDG